MSNAPKTLIILSPGFPKDEGDTVCLPFLQDFVMELNEQFPMLKIVVLAFDYPFNSTGYLWNKNEVISFNGWGKKYFRKIYKWFGIWGIMKKVKRANDVIGIFSLWCGECAYIGNRFSKKYQLKHYCWVLGQDAKKENRYVARIAPRAEALLAISDFIKDEFQKNHGISPGRVIPIGVRTTKFSKENTERDIDILGVGSLIPLKQYDVFIEVINLLRSSFPNIKVVLCGKGPEETKIRSLIEKYRLGNNITLSGELPQDDILDKMKHCKVFLHTSNYEGLGTVCIEALYSGCHLISFVQPMYSTIENWQIVKTKEEMAAQAALILNNPATQYNPVLLFNLDKIAKEIMGLYGYA